MRIQRKRTVSGSRKLRLREVQLYDMDNNLMNAVNNKAVYTFQPATVDVTTGKGAQLCGNGVVNNVGDNSSKDFCEAESLNGPVLEIKLSACLHGLSRVVVLAG